MAPKERRAELQGLGSLLSNVARGWRSAFTRRWPREVLWGAGGVAIVYLLVLLIVRRSVVLKVGLALSLAALLAIKQQQFCVGGQDLTDRVLKLSACMDSALDLFDPVLGNVLDVLFAVDHEREGPGRMPRVSRLGAVAGGLSAPQMGKGERAG